MSESGEARPSKPPTPPPPPSVEPPPSPATPASATPPSDPHPSTLINFSLPLDRKLMGLFDTSYLTDVEFLVGGDPSTPPTSIRAHKLILALGSPVFLTQFFGNLPSESVVALPDLELEAFRILLQYIYGGGGAALLGDTSSSAAIESTTLPILYAAHKYDVPGLQDLCALKLSLALDSWNVLAILHTAELYHLPDLAGKCWTLIQSNTRSVLNFHQHSVDYATLLRIVRDDGLSIEEVKLFEFLCSWAENECEREDIVPSVDNKLRRLGDLLRHVRFPTMSGGDFANRVAPKGLLTEKQVARVLTYICSSPTNRPFLRVDFPTTRRREGGGPIFQAELGLTAQQPHGGPGTCTFLNNPLSAALLFHQPSGTFPRPHPLPLHPNPNQPPRGGTREMFGYHTSPPSLGMEGGGGVAPSSYHGVGGGSLFGHGGPSGGFMSYATSGGQSQPSLFHIQRSGIEQEQLFGGNYALSTRGTPGSPSAPAPQPHPRHRFSRPGGGSGAMLR